MAYFDPAACLFSPPPARSRRPKRDARLWVRVSADDLARWKSAASETRAPVSSWLRSVADECAAAGRDPSAWRADLNRLLRDLNSGVGNDINQLTRLFNASQKAGRPADIASAAASLAAMAADLESMRTAAVGLLGAGTSKRRPR